jgi:peroxiredoxin Q/BCP
MAKKKARSVKSARSTPRARVAKKPQGKKAARKASAKKPALRGKVKRAPAAAAKPARRAASTGSKAPAGARRGAGPRSESAPRAKVGGVVAPGKPAPTFELLDEAGKSVSSTSLAGSPYVLYFYPKDDTPGCTKEACGFRDELPGFGKRRIRVLGVSPDSVQSHAKFREKYRLPFTLLSDPERTLANAYGVWVKKKNYGREYMGIARSTFLVDANGVVRRAWRGVKVPGHVEAVLAATSDVA